MRWASGKASCCKEGAPCKPASRLLQAAPCGKFRVLLKHLCISPDLLPCWLRRKIAVWQGSLFCRGGWKDYGKIAPFFFWILLVSYQSRVRSRFAAGFPLTSFVTWSLSTRQRSDILEGFIRYIKQSLTSCIKKYCGTRQSRQLFSRWPDFSPLRGAGKYSFICFFTKMSFFMSSILSLILHRACEHFRVWKQDILFQTSVTAMSAVPVSPFNQT